MDSDETDLTIEEAQRMWEKSLPNDRELGVVRSLHEAGCPDKQPLVGLASGGQVRCRLCGRSVDDG